MDNNACIDPQLLGVNDPLVGASSAPIARISHVIPSIELGLLTGLPIAEGSLPNVSLSDGERIHQDEMWIDPEDPEVSTELNGSSDNGSLPSIQSHDHNQEGQQSSQVTQAPNELRPERPFRPHNRPRDYDVLRRLVLDPDSGSMSISSAIETLNSIKRFVQNQFRSTNQVLRLISSGSQVERLGASFLNQLLGLINLLSGYSDHTKRFKVVGKIVQGCHQAWSGIEVFCIHMSDVHRHPSRVEELRRAFLGLRAKLYVERKKLKTIIPGLADFLAGTSRRSRAGLE